MSYYVLSMQIFSLTTLIGLRPYGQPGQLPKGNEGYHID